MAVVMRVGVAGAVLVVFFSCIASKVVPDVDDDPIQSILAKDSNVSLPPFIVNGSVVVVKNGTVNVSAVEQPSGFLTYSNATPTSSNVRVLVSRDGNWTDISWNTYPILIEHLYNTSHISGSPCYTFQVPDAPPGCVFEPEWHDNCSYPRMRCNCSMNEVFSYCGTRCGSHCGDNVTCSAECNQGCFCSPGYKRNATGHCVPENACPPPVSCPVFKMVQPPPNCTYVLIPEEDGCFTRKLQCNDTVCSANMTMTDCGTHCPNTCGMDQEYVMCNHLCQTGCFCKNGYWFNPLSGSCVAKTDCPAEVTPDPTCFYPDLPSAPEGCHYEDKVQFDACPMPTLRCNGSDSESSVCPIAYISPAPKNCYFERHIDGFGCTYPVLKCPPTCPPNEVYRNCSSACEPTCDQQSIMCTLQCMPPKCQCKSGYVRNNKSACVLASECPKVDACLNNSCGPHQQCVSDPKQCLIPPCPQYKCVDENPCGMMSLDPILDSAGHFMDCDMCRDSNHFCLRLSDRHLCCTKTDLISPSSQVLAEIAPIKKNSASEGQPLNTIVDWIKATRWNNAWKPIANFLFIHAEPALSLDDYQLVHDMEAAFVASCRPLTTMGCILKGGVKPLFGPSADHTQVTIDLSDVLLECADGRPLPTGAVSIVFDIDPFFSINRDTCTVVSYDIMITGNGKQSNQFCDVVGDYGAFGFNAYLRIDDEVLSFDPVLYGDPVFEPVTGWTEESFALKLFTLRDYAKSQGPTLSCTQDSIQSVTAENVTGSPLDLIYLSFSGGHNQTADPENSTNYEMVSNFTDYLVNAPTCGTNREYINIAHDMACPYKKAMRIFLSATFNEWQQAVGEKQVVQQVEPSSKPNDRFYVKPKPADDPSQSTPPKLNDMDACVESTLKTFFENDWIGTTVPLAWTSILTSHHDPAKDAKKEPVKVATDSKSQVAHDSSACANGTLATLRREVASHSSNAQPCNKDEQLPHFFWSKDDHGNIYQGYRSKSGASIWQRRAVCSCSTSCSSGSGGNNGVNKRSHENISEMNDTRVLNETDDSNITSQLIESVKDEDDVSSYMDCISTVLRKSGYKGADLNLQQLSAMAATFDKSLVKAIVNRVTDTCGSAPPQLVKQFNIDLDM